MVVDIADLEIYFEKMKRAFGAPPTDEPVPTHYHQAWYRATYGEYIPQWCVVCKKDFVALDQNLTCSKHCADQRALIYRKQKK